MTNINIPGTYVSIIVTHQNRIRCLIDYLTKDYKDKNQKFDFKIKKIKNCGIIKLEVSYNNYVHSDNWTNFKMNLIHEGELNDNNGTNGTDKKDTDQDKYYKKKNSTNCLFNLFSNNQYFEKNEVNTIKTGKVLEGLFPSKINDNIIKILNNISRKYIFYIIRHGEGEHNVKKGFKKKIKNSLTNYDPKLTSKGIQQANNAAEPLLKDLLLLKTENTNTNLNNITFFSSDLLRTRLTLLHILNQIKIKTQTQNNIQNAVKQKINELIGDNPKCIILPCSHELQYVKGGKCDGNLKQKFYALAKENISKCKDINTNSNSSEGCKDSEEKDEEQKLHEINLNHDWSYYFNFYDNGTRYSRSKKRSRCRKTDMLTQAIDIISDTIIIPIIKQFLQTEKNKYKPVPGGGAKYMLINKVKSKKYKNKRYSKKNKRIRKKRYSNCKKSKKI
tara:strand:+ start:225 stop:1559 length:1335 start_codon:yes stop_codon:yes gene_type:complete